MSSSIKIREEKIRALSLSFNKLGYKGSKTLGRNEFSLFLNKNTKSGQFNEILLEKLFHFLSLDKKSSISIEDFILGFLQFEEDLRKNAELFKIKFAKEQEIYSNILRQYRTYQSEKLNSEGFCENSKVYGEITDIDIKKKLEGIKEIIIIILYNDNKEEMHFKIGDINSNEKLLNKKFEFKPTSRKDHFEFIMKGINNRDQIFDIGSRVFPLDNVESQEEYLVQIIIPEVENQDQIAAYIHTKIILYWSDFKHYENLKKKQEKRLKKYSAAANQAVEYLKMIREIYGGLSRVKPDLIIDINNEKLMRRKSPEINVNFRNTMILKGKRKELDNNYYVEFNNQRKIAKKEIKLRVDFYNSKNGPSPYALTHSNKHKYKLSNNVSQEIINNAEDILNKLLPIEKDFNNINQKLKKDLYKKGNLNPNIKNINIKKKTKIYKSPNNPKKAIIYQGKPEIFLNDKEGNNAYLQSNFQYKENNNNYKAYIKHKKNMTETKVSLNKNQNNYNIDIYDSLYQVKGQNYSQNPTQSQKQINEKNKNIYIQSGNNFNINNLLQQNNSQKENQAQTQYKTQIEYFNNRKETFPKKIDQININNQNKNEKMTNYENIISYKITDKEIFDINSNSNEQNIKPNNNKGHITNLSNKIILNNRIVNKGMEFKEENVNINFNDNNAANLPIINMSNSNSYNNSNPIIHSHYNDSNNLNNSINNIGNPNNFTFSSGN